jgi:hypothetical protein
VIALLLYRRVWRSLPVFCACCTCDLLSNVVTYASSRYLAASYSAVYLAATALDVVLVFGVLIEVAWSILRPLRASLSSRTLLAVSVLILTVGAAIWPFTGIHALASLSPAIRNIVRLQQTAAMLRILFFLVLAGCSQLLSIGWRDRELQIATGVGFYAVVSVAVEALHAHLTMGPQYRLLNQAVIVSYIVTMLYWLYCFAQQETARREFSPQMQSFLLAVAGNARTARMALADSTAAKAPNLRER